MPRATAEISNTFTMGWSSLLIIVVSFYASLAGTENIQTARLKKSDHEVPICADTAPTGSDTEAVILWDTTPSSNCTLAYTEVIDLTRLNVTGYTLTDLDPKTQYNVSVTCKSGNTIPRQGEVSFRTGTHYSSQKCTSAEWVTKGVNTGTNVTLCLEPMVPAVTFNATSPLEDCFLWEGRPEQPTTKKHIHLLPYTSTVHVPASGTTYSINCTSQPSMVFQSEPLTYIEDLTEPICYTKALEALVLPASTTDPSGPDINRVRPSFTSAHIGLFVVLLIAIMTVIIVVTFIIVKRIRLQHRRQGQRLLVEEDPTEAAFRDLQEMET